VRTAVQIIGVALCLWSAGIIIGKVSLAKEVVFRRSDDTGFRVQKIQLILGQPGTI